MKRAHWTITRLCLAGGLLLGTVVSLSSAQEGAGSARVSKPRKVTPVQPAGFSEFTEDFGEMTQDSLGTLAGPPHRAADIPVRTAGYGGHGMAMHSYGAPCGGSGCMGCMQGNCGYRTDWRNHDWNCDCRSCRFHHRTQSHSLAVEQGMCNICGKEPGCYYHDCTGRDMLNYFGCKFGYFIPTGNGGKGTPLFGHYTRVYPQDVNHFDQRDGQMYSAQGYGVPVAVPLAPVVGHAYNLGWGVPSSRLTPISHVAPRY